MSSFVLECLARSEQMLGLRRRSSLQLLGYSARWPPAERHVR